MGDCLLQHQAAAPTQAAVEPCVCSFYENRVEQSTDVSTSTTVVLVVLLVTCLSTGGAGV